MAARNAGTGVEASTMVYNDVAGRDVGRLAALSDGIFAFAFTVLVLDVRVPEVAGVRSEAELWHALVLLAPQLLTVVMTFLTLGIFWIGQQTQLSHLKRADRNMAWLHIAFLFAVVAEPFSTKLLSAFITYRVALIFYWLNIVVLGCVAFATWSYAGRTGLLDDEAPLARRAVERRIIVAQALYAFATALCAIDTYVSIVAIVMIQLNYALAPRLRWLYRL